MNSRGFIVVNVTGGPCAGKTTLLCFIIAVLMDKGFYPIIVPEAATQLINQGISPATLGPIEFQRRVIVFSLEQEEQAFAQARALTEAGHSVVVLLDRGIIDGVVYVPQHEFEALLGDRGFSYSQVLNTRQDAVLFLHSVAHDRPELYTLANNAARSETVEQAKELNQNLLRAYLGHSHLRIIDNSGSFEDKQRRVLEHLFQFLGIPVPIEIENKYVLDAVPDPFPYPHGVVSIEQVYVQNSDPLVSERIRKRTFNGHTMYFHTIKTEASSFGESARIEKERPISAGEYAEMVKRAKPHSAVIRKKRICFAYENQYFELDVFENVPGGLILLELELTRPGQEVILPPFAENARNVTSDPHYRNAAIAQRIVST
jgi:CYTH domain-containing protein/predicted ATPase